MKPWKSILDEQVKLILGETKVDLLNDDCTHKECNAGNFFADAAVYAFTKLKPYNETYWTQASIALINPGTIRVPLFKGNLSYGNMAAMAPFENRMTAFTLPGSKLIEALEFSLREIDLASNRTTSSIFLQVSGVKATYNITKPYGQRLQSLQVICQNCSMPVYSVVNATRDYRIITSDYLAAGGVGFRMFRDYGRDFQKELTDLEAISNYVKDNSPITTKVEDRITVVY